MIGFVLFGGDNHFVLLWQMCLILGRINNHSVYELPWFPKWNNSAKFHDDHHRLFNKNFGFIQILDRFHKTNA